MALDPAHKLDDYIAMIDNGQKILAALATFVTVGLGSLVIGVRKLLQQNKSAEQKMEPVRREITERGNDTLSNRVDTIVTRIDVLDTERQRQHEDNSERLGRIEDRMDHMEENIGEIRKVMNKIMSKLSGLT